MPKWGLNESQRRTQPWGLLDALLKPAKTITDPVAGDVYVTELELRVVDSPAMQRLKRVRQLGMSYQIYPGATHSRFSHALGALRSAQDLLDAVIDNHSGPHHEPPDLLDQWEEEGRLDECLAEATVLARLGALLHDLCHVPFGHTIEDDLLVLDEHDKNEPRFNALWSQVDDGTRSIIESADGDFFLELQRLILAKKPWTKTELDPSGEPVEVERRSRYPFVADIVGNTICADLLDYIRRDHHNCGLPLRVGTRFMNDFYVSARGAHPEYSERMVIRVTRSGRRRADVVSELIKYLQYRYELSERVLVHHAKTAADAMIGKMLEMWADAEWTDAALARFPDLGTEALGGLAEDIDALRRAVRVRAPEAVNEVEAGVRGVLEREFTSRSDDGLLEQLSLSNQTADSRRRRGVGAIATAILDRRLYKLVGRAEGELNRAASEGVFHRWGAPSARRRLEQDAARFAGVTPRWHVLLWIPNPSMKLKVADVLVKANDWIGPLSKHESSGNQIVEKHMQLWAVSVYVPPEVAHDPAMTDPIVSFLGARMGLEMASGDGRIIPRPQQLAARRVSEHLQLAGPRRVEFEEMVVAAKASEVTFDNLLAQSWQVATSLGLTSDSLPDGL